MRKKILFVNESLACAGGEKSLLNLLSAIDHDRYDVYLQLFRYGEPWDKLVDERVTVLSPIPYTEFTSYPLSRAFIYAITHCKLRWLVARLNYSFRLRFGKNLNNVKRSIMYWETQKSCFNRIENEYDYIIAYAQGIPTFYVADKAVNGKKAAWINVTYCPDEPAKSYIEEKYESFRVVNSVSEEIERLETEHWPALKSKSVTIRDIMDPRIIYKLADADSEQINEEGVLTLVTLGRLTYQKGYDITIEAARILKERNIKFKWFILGKGPLEKEIRNSIEENGLSEMVFLLGVKDNPYPYLRQADIYVQTSRHEGFGIAIAEARTLNIPVVATRFNTVFMQMKDKVNGLVTDMNGKSVADAIVKLHEDRGLYISIKRNLESEKKDNSEVLEKFYSILD